MKKFLPLLGLTLVALFGPNKLLGDHVMGADMGYQCLGNGRYKIIIKFYRDCRGASAPPNWSLLYWYAGNNGGQGTSRAGLSLNRVGIRDISPRCSTSSSPCNPQNTSYTGEGVEEHTYETTIDISKAPFSGSGLGSTYCELTLAYNQCCRNAAITTGATWADFWTTATINVCNLNKSRNKCNTTPVLTNVPVAYACCNQAYYFNNGALDTVDYDSLSYRMAPALAGVPNISVPYTNPFNFRIPVTPYCVPPGKIDCAPNINTKPPRGFFMDTSTGDIIFTPTKCDEVSVLVLEITEWRKDTTGKWVWVGKTRRDMQIIVKDDCGYNKAPTIEGPTSSKVCEGDKLCFKIYGKDETFTPHQTVPDTVLLSWNKGIPGATFTINNPRDREKEAEFCWQTRVGQASDVAYSFTVTANDQHCPKPAQSIRGFKVRVNPRAFSTRKYTILKCGRFAFDASVPAGFKGTPTYRWSIRDSLGSNELFFRTKKTDTVTFKYGGKYIVVHTVNNPDNCPTIYRDTVIIPNPPIVELAKNDTFACHGTGIVFNPRVRFAKPTTRFYWWKPVIHDPGDTLNTLTINNITTDTAVIVRVTDGDGCNFYDTAAIFVKPLPVIGLGPDQRICTYENATFDAQNADTVKYLWNSGDTTRTITKNVAGPYIVTVTETKWKCQLKDTVELFVNDTVVSLAGTDRAICNFDSFQLTALHRPMNQTGQYRWTNLTSGNLLGSNASYKVSPRNTNPAGGAPMFFDYELFTRVTQGGHTCEHYDTMRLRVNPLPRVWWDPKPLRSQCFAFGDIPLYTFVNPKAGSNIGVWAGSRRVRNNMVDSLAPNQFIYRTTRLDNNTLQNGNFRQDKIYLQFKDTNNCINIDSTTQRINGTPMVQLQKRTYCQDAGTAPLANSIVRPQPSISVNITWRVLDAPAGIDRSTRLREFPVGTQRFWLDFGNPTEDNYAGTYKLEYCVEDRLTGCRKCDTNVVDVITEPQVQVTSPPPLCVNWDTIDLDDYVLLNGQKPLPGDGWFTILEYDYDRNHPKVTGTTLPKGHMFVPAFGAKTWYIKYSNNATGCLKEDSFYIYVNDTPDAVLLPTVTLCSTDAPLDLDSRIDGARTRPAGQVSNWSGPQVSGRMFDPNVSGTKIVEGPYFLKMSYTDNNGCADTETYIMYVRMRPQVNITTSKPAAACEGSTFPIQSSKQFASSLIWRTINGSDGTFDNTAADNIVYTHGTGDRTNGNAWVRVTTVPEPNEVCPQSSDSIQIILHPYPVITMDAPVDGCVPLTASFNGAETRGIDPTRLRWRWDFGNGDTSDQQNPTGVNYPNQGRYTVSLRVTNLNGNCATTLTNPDYVQAYPIPTAAFTTDPAFKTTVALPKFRTFNQSSIAQNPFSPTLSYRWDFGTSYDPFDDTFTQFEPRYAYGKDTNTYYITLIVTSSHGCSDTITRPVYVGPDIIVWIPDVFTPDGAGPGRNNTFNITASNYKAMKMTIYNRWGEKMYETDDINKGWDGRSGGQECPDGVYIYHVEVSDFDNKVYKFDGTLTLMR